MKLQILLLFVIIAAYDVLSWSKIKFPLKVLQPDLQAISQYHRKDLPLQAFVHWPDSISFSIEGEVDIDKDESYLKISGTFEIASMGFFPSLYDTMYYKNGGFYFKAGILYSWKSISPEKYVTYIQPELTRKTDVVFSIKYFGLKELKNEVQPFYSNNKYYVENVLEPNPATFLATVSDCKEHFVEYTFWGENEPNTLADGKLRVLLGSAKNSELTLTNNIEADRLVFDQRNLAFKIPENSNINSRPLEDVFGVRMATRGILEKNYYRFAEFMLNSDYLIYRPPIKLEGPMLVDFLQKAQTVEPRLHSKPKAHSKIWNGPKSVKFQVHGEVLIKSVNLDKDGHIDHQCPFTIEHLNKGGLFQIEEHEVDKIYTNDVELWPECGIATAVDDKKM